MTVFRYVFLLLLGGSILTIQAQEIDSAEALIAPEYDKVGGLRRFFFGDSYRQLFNTPVRMRKIDLSKEKGGLQIVKLGGGMQTQSLRLVDPTGREWVLRSIQKYPERSLPENLRQTIVKDIVQDQISITHPFGALTVPPFNRALELLHAEPELVFVGDDPLLGEYRPIFKNRAYMFEPRMPYEDSDTDNTLKVIRKLLEDNDIQTDQELTLRARLLDMVLGDWDRHEDNWRWDPVKNKGKRTYSAVPRDRDKVYYKTSGIFPVLLSKQWLKAHLQPFSPHIRNVSHWNFNARHFDRFFLNQLSEKEWEKEIAFVQKQLTDSLIYSAIREMPDTIVKLSGDELYRFIRSRRDELDTTGMEYYRVLAEVVDIPLSAKNEFVTLDYKSNGNILLQVNNKKKDGTEGRTLVKRTFTPGETKEIRIYGIDGNDTYTVLGTGISPIKVRLVGGKGSNTYVVDPTFANGGKLYLYDIKNSGDGSLPKDLPIRYRLSKDTSVHSYDYYNFVYDRKGLLFDLNYGADKGFNFGLGYVFEKQGFKKYPFANRHSFKVKYLTGRRSFGFNYEGIVKDIWRKQDLHIELDIDGPRNLSNFFGYGNNSVYQKGKDYGLKYYRNRYDKADANIILQYPVTDHFRLEYGSVSTYFQSEEKNNTGRFLEEFHLENPIESVFGKHFFTGAKVGLNFDSRDEKYYTKRGIHTFVNMNWQAEIGGEQRQYSKLSSAFSFYKTYDGDAFTFTNKTGLDAVWGNPYFYQYVQLGGDDNLRGFNSQRFTGNTSLYNNLEARAKLFSFDSYLVPATVGLVGFYDIGRVWMKGEKSKKWHQGYGAGLYFLPADIMYIQATLGFSKEATLSYFSLGVIF